MQTVNRFTVLGNVGQVHTFENVTKVSIATDRGWKDEQGNRQTRTDWMQVTVFQKEVANYIAENVKKGDRVFVEGRITTSSFGEGDDRKYSTDLIATIFNRLEG